MQGSDRLAVTQNQKHINQSPQLEKIPEAKAYPIVQHTWLLELSKTQQSIMKVARDIGPIMRFRLPAGHNLIIITNYAFAAEALDTKRFSKEVPKPLRTLKIASGNGLFTADNDDPEWALAHRLLMPAFSQQAMENYHELMLDISLQMVDKWSRLHPDTSLDIPSEMTKLTFDVIALCGFNYRLNSFYQTETHEFIKAMTGALDESMRNDKRPHFLSVLLGKERQLKKDANTMHSFVDKIIKEGRQQTQKQQSNDLLNLMLNMKDPETGEGLSDENIRYQLVTFMIAGHETTSSMLAFTLHALATHPEILKKARAEADRVLGPATNLPTYKKVQSLDYIEQCLLESLRLWPTAPGFALSANEDTILGGRYQIHPEEIILLMLPAIHRDPTIWGDNPEQFNPDHFHPDQMAKRPANAFRAFGNGPRACIGRQFALHEAKMVIGLILQRFNFEQEADYQLDIQETLTIKPAGLRMNMSLRPGLNTEQLLLRSLSANTKKPSPMETTALPEPVDFPYHGTPLHVAYGSNMGSTQGFAENFARQAKHYGYEVKLTTLDQAVDDMPTEGAFIAISASYNGHPPDNAQRFCRWLQSQNKDALKDLPFLVFGCGHKDWAATYQAIPTLIYDGLSKAGANAIAPKGEGDAKQDLLGDFRAWYSDTWPKVHQSLKVDLEHTPQVMPQLQVTVISAPERPGHLSKHMVPMAIVENRNLVDMSAPYSRAKHHLEIKLPEGMNYEPGDYLAVMPVNSPKRVQEVAEILGQDSNQVLMLKGEGSATLPLNKPISLGALLSRHLELSSTLTRGQLKTLAEHAQCPPDKAKLLSYCGEDPESQQLYQREIVDKSISMVHMLKALPSCRLPLSVALALLPPLNPRLYSISSSPKAEENTCSLTVSMLRTASRSGPGIHEGVCSNYLAKLKAGQHIFAMITRPTPAFELPKDPATPLIMIGAGTGIAPFRAFIQHRILSGQKGPMDLFFGCDDPGIDFLYKKELESISKQAVLNVYTAFSQAPEGELTFVQHRLEQSKTQIQKRLKDGAHVYICGDGNHMAPAVLGVLDSILKGMGHGGVGTLKKEGRLFEDTWKA